MHKFLAVFPLLFFSICLQAQLPISNVKLFTIINQNDTIQFIKIDADTTQTKPTILFCAGSLPIPLIIEYSAGVFLMPSINNFDYKKISERYNIIILSKPYTPVVSNKNHLNNQYAYVPDTLKPNNFDIRYWKNNYLENHVERWNIVLDFLRKQTWVDKNRIIVCGHSQGSHEALQLAKQNLDIYALGYFSGNLLGRYQSLIQQVREDANSGKIPQDEAQTKIEEQYDFWKTVCRDSTEFSVGENDAKRAWKSFSISEIELLTSIKTPVFIAYGTKDTGPQTSDVMPVYFELAGKTNYKMRPFVGCGHNFEEIKPDGSSDWKKMHWVDAMNEFLQWVESIKN